MSYILDALRKADAERERGNVPGIHAQPTFAGAPRSAQPTASRPWVVMLGGAALVLLAIVAVLIWKMNGSSTAPVNVASVAGNAPVVPSPAPAPATVVSGNATAVTPALVTPPPPLAQLPKPPPEAAPAPRKVAKAPAAQIAPTPAAAQASNATSAKGALPAAPAASASEPRLYTYAELPDDIRRQVPTMTVGGSVYSPVPANRFMFVNGQVLHEGDVIAPGVVLLQIRVKAAVLTVSGYRYLMNY
jgi:general secretion pathway protein B